MSDNISHVSEPLKDKKDIKAVEQYLKEHNERDYVIWVLGLNSGLRVSDIVGLNVSDVVDKTHITIIEKKTQKRKSFYINDKLKKVLKSFTKDRNIDEPLFLGKQGSRLDRGEVSRFLDKVHKELKLKIKIGTHTMRKTFGYHHYQQFKDAVILQKIFNHSSLHITLMYIGIEQDEIDNTYKLLKI